MPEKLSSRSKGGGRREEGGVEGLAITPQDP
jgi:hypothetical protein